jgi:hypothetical protein
MLLAYFCIKQLSYFAGRFYLFLKSRKEEKHSSCKVNFFPDMTWSLRDLISWKSPFLRPQVIHKLKNVLVPHSLLIWLATGDLKSAVELEIYFVVYLTFFIFAEDPIEAVLRNRIKTMRLRFRLHSWNKSVLIYNFRRKILKIFLFTKSLYVLFRVVRFYSAMSQQWCGSGNRNTA